MTISFQKSSQHSGSFEGRVACAALLGRTAIQVALGVGDLVAHPSATSEGTLYRIYSGFPKRMSYVASTTQHLMITIWGLLFLPHLIDSDITSMAHPLWMQYTSS
jgi:hypothetical protein